MLKGAVKASSGSGSVKDPASGGIASLGRVADGIEGHAIDDSLATEKVLWVRLGQTSSALPCENWHAHPAGAWLESDPDPIANTYLLQVAFDDVC